MVVASLVCRRGKSPQKAFNLSPTTVGNTDLNQKKKKLFYKGERREKKNIRGRREFRSQPIRERREEKKEKKKMAW